MWGKSAQAKPYAISWTPALQTLHRADTSHRVLFLRAQNECSQLGWMWAQTGDPRHLGSHEGWSEAEECEDRWVGSGGHGNSIRDPSLWFMGRTRTPLSCRPVICLP